MNWRRIFGLPQTDTGLAGQAGSPGRNGRVGTVATEPMTSLGPIPLELEQPRERWVRRSLRILLAAALVVLVLVGLRALIRPYPTPAAYVPPPSLTYDRGSAQAVAARWADAYLTLNPADTAGTARAAALAADAAAGVDTSGGVAPTAVQTVETVLPGAVRVADDGRSAVVTVLARVRTGDTGGTARWVTLAVPVGSDGQRPVVTATAAYVSLPTPQTAQAPAGPAGAALDEDSQLEAATRASAAAWFAAYGGKDPAALAAISAPGATVSPLAGLTLKNLDAWRVYAGDDTTRRATAGVTWTTPAGDVTQHYDITLSAVRSGATTDWRVLTATATTSR